MTLKERIMEDMKQAMKAKDKSTLEAIRMLRSALRNREIEKQAELDDDGVIQVLANQIKKRKESIEQFRDAGRMDLVEREEKQLQALEIYMPQKLSLEEIKRLVDEVVAETGASSMRDMGKVMSAIMPRLQGKADGKEVNQMVREKLGGSA
ncbi:GatB/YqeY domain-containing protein [Candidatus Poribacteria bacterium]|nr:GatB/YqeY domain-containing protein [Candidatus Poribacteria bacterium]